MNNLSAEKVNTNSNAKTPEAILFDCEVDLMYIRTLLEGADSLLEDLCDFFMLDTQAKTSVIEAQFKRYGSIAEIIRALVLLMSNKVKNNIEAIDKM